MKRSIFSLFLFTTVTACTAYAGPEQTRQVSVAGEDYLVLDNVRLVNNENWQRVATPEIDLDSGPKPVQQASEQQPIASFGSMVLVPYYSVTAQSEDNKKSSARKQFFIQSKQTSQVYIVNGEVFAQVESPEAAQAIAQDYDIKYVLFLKKEKTALFEIPLNDQLFATVNSMEQDQRIQQVQLKLTDKLLVPH